MKEIWIEKLVELLNEYEPRIAGNGEHYDNIWWYRHFMSDKTVANNATRYIVSKEYGFIKWLVENDKIDMKKHFYDKMCCVWYPDLNIVLCELAVSDTPIEDLISYLK